MKVNAPRRMLVFWALSFGAGIFVGARLEITLFLWICCGLSLLLSILLKYGKQEAWPAGFVVMFFLGAAICSHAAYPALPEEGKYRVSATVRDKITLREEDGRVAVWLMGPRSLTVRARHAIVHRLEQLLGEESPLATALLIGVTDGMPEEMREGFRQAGVAHVLSVSGLHAMIIMSAVIALLDRLSPAPRQTLLISGIFLAAYCALVGWEAPLLRAAVLVL